MSPDEQETLLSSLDSFLDQNLIRDVMEIVLRLNIRFGDMSLMLFDCQNKMCFDDPIDGSVHFFEFVGSKLPQRFGDFDMPSRDVHFHM